MCRPDVDPKLSLPNVYDLTAALIQHRVNVCLMGRFRPTAGIKQPSTEVLIWVGPVVFQVQRLLYHQSYLYIAKYNNDIGLQITPRKWQPNKHDALTQCWFYVGPPSATLAQRKTSIGSMRRVCWVVSTLVLKISSTLFSLLLSRPTGTCHNFLTGRDACWLPGGGAVQTASRVEERPQKLYRVINNIPHQTREIQC